MLGRELIVLRGAVHDRNHRNSFHEDAVQVTIGRNQVLFIGECRDLLYQLVSFFVLVTTLVSECFFADFLEGNQTHHLVETIPRGGCRKFCRLGLHGQVEGAESQVLVPYAVVNEFLFGGEPDFVERFYDNLDGVFPVGPALRAFNGEIADGLFFLV